MDKQYARQMAQGISISLVLLLLIVTGCASPNRLAEPIGKFRTATSTTSSIVSPTLSLANHVERAYQLQMAIAEGRDINGKAFLTPVYSLDGIALRQKSFTLIELYTMRLSQLADAKTGEEVRESSAAVGTQLTQLGLTIANLSKSGSTDEINKFGGAITTLFQTVSSIWVDETRSRLLKRAINECAPVVESVLDLLETDMHRLQQAQVQLALEKFAQTVSKFNDTPLEKREGQAKELLQHAKDYELLVSVSAKETIKSMRDAHAAMVEAVNSRSTANIQLFAQSVDLFSSRAIETASALKILLH